jgi:hypothetical protein
MGQRFSVDLQNDRESTGNEKQVPTDVESTCDLRRRWTRREQSRADETGSWKNKPRPMAGPSDRSQASTLGQQKLRRTETDPGAICTKIRRGRKSSAVK